jgi:hypothetical protein
MKRSKSFGWVLLMLLSILGFAVKPVFAANVPAKTILPQIFNISPASGPAAGGQLVTISGMNFTPNPTVTFGGAVAPVISATNTQIVVAAPPGTAGKVNVVVTVAGSVSNAATYTYAGPIINNISPAAGPSAGGQTVTIMGANFNGSPVVTFGGSVAPVISATNTQIVVITPAGSPGNVSVVVTVAGVVSNAVLYSYASPVISNISPAVGPDSGGQVVTISGVNFSPNPTVTFNGIVAPVNSATNTQITVTTPAGSPGTANVLVSVAGNSSNSFPYTYARSPVITNISFAAGPLVGGQKITITGTDFVTGATTVSFGGTVGTNVTVSSSTQLVVTSPAHSAGIVNITVSTAGGASNPLNYTYDANAPIIVSVNPASGPASGGQTITISGVNFASSSNIVLIGGNVAPILTENINEIVVASPAGPIGSTQVEVSVSGVASNSFPYSYN